ncbi:hypothetical protein MASR2M48_07050 [Spirochaetota bacterium]
MRMAAWHGADHLMVIRTTGQSHINGLMEGTPEGHRRRSNNSQADTGKPQGL